MGGSKSIEILQRFWKAVLDSDFGVLETIVSDDSVFYIGGKSALAGSHKGAAGIGALIRKADELTADTLSAVRDDSADFMASEHHGVILDRIIATRDGKSLDSHIALVAHVEGGKLDQIFLYLENQYAFDEFFS